MAAPKTPDELFKEALELKNEADSVITENFAKGIGDMSPATILNMTADLYRVIEKHNHIIQQLFAYACESEKN